MKVRYMTCAYSSGDRAPVSGTGCEGSNPSRRTTVNKRLHSNVMPLVFYFAAYYTEIT